MGTGAQSLTFFVLILPFLAALIAPALTRVLRHNAAWVLALAPLFIFLHFSGFLETVAAGASVTGEIVRHGLGEKIVVFKFKRRKNYARKQGHRQGFTEVKISDITLG